MQKELPIGWINAELRFLGEYINGRAFKPTEWRDSGLPIIRIQNLNDPSAAFNFSNIQHEPKYLVQRGELLMAWSASLGVYIWEKDDAWLNQHIFKVLENERIVTKRFLFYALQISISEFYKKTHGSGIVHITKPVFESHKVPLPPLPTQQRMVAKLDTLFGHLDALKTRLDRIPQLLKDFRQKVLTQAVTGKLTEEWREGKELEDIKILFSKIDFRRNQHKKSKISNLKLDLRSDLDLFELPSKWAWADLNFLMDEENSFCYGVVQPGKDVKNEQKLIRVQDLSNGKILNDQLRGISWKIDKEYTRSKVNEGDLLVTVVGTIGRTAIVAKESVGLNIARAVAKIPIRDCNGHYIRIFFDSEIGQQWLVGDAREVARKTLNLDQLKTLPIAVPPVEEQKEIVRRVESLFAKADQIEASYQKLTAKIEQLPQALLAKAFRGELVEQLPTDGDARQLLEEIRKAKTGLEKGGKIKKMKGDEETRMVAEGGSRYGLRRI